jgi:hypothetical protein
MSSSVAITEVAIVIVPRWPLAPVRHHLAAPARSDTALIHAQHPLSLVALLFLQISRSTTHAVLVDSSLSSLGSFAPPRDDFRPPT